MYISMHVWESLSPVPKSTIGKTGPASSHLCQITNVKKKKKSCSQWAHPNLDPVMDTLVDYCIIVHTLICNHRLLSDVDDNSNNII